MKRGLRVWQFGAALVLSGVLVTACSPNVSNPTPQPSPSESTPRSAAPSESPTLEKPAVDPPERPAAMEKETIKGAIAAAEYYISLFPYINSTGEFAEWDSMVDERCENFCHTARKDAAELHSAGGFTTGGEVEIVSSDGGGPYSGDGLKDAYVVDLDTRIAAAESILGDGSRESYEADRVNFRVILVWTDRGWSVLDFWEPDEA